mgnify:CR=1 FL=1
MNTLYQLFSLAKNRPHMLEIAERLLFIPELLAWLLTGEQHNEYTMATISQLYNYEAGDWDYPLMSGLGVPGKLFSPVVMPGSDIGSLLPSVCNDLGIEPMKLIAVGSHDTASAVAGSDSRGQQARSAMLEIVFRFNQRRACFLPVGDSCIGRRGIPE